MLRLGRHGRPASPRPGPAGGRGGPVCRRDKGLFSDLDAKQVEERRKRQRDEEEAEEGEEERAGNRSDDEEQGPSGRQPSSTTLCQEFFLSIIKKPGAAASMQEWMKLAELIFVMVPGSVEEERMFSAMTYIKNLWRNRLSAYHLTCCARAFSHSTVTLTNFNYERAIAVWMEAAARRKV